MKQVVINVYFLLAITSIVNAQTYNNPYPNIIQPSPNAASLGRYAEIPITLETGVPNISIPLYAIQSKGISLPISISYHASGIKVMDQASSVGLGWSLNSGGSITRIKQGIYDERPNGFYNIVFPDPQDPDYENRMKALYTGMNMDDLNKMDGQPDIFYYNFGGKSGKFMFKNRTAKGLPPEILTFPYVPLKITFLDDWKTIQVVDEDGTLYVFGKSLQGVDYRELSTWGSPGPSNQDGYPYPSTWHLVNIVSANKANAVTLKYDFGYSSYMYNTSNSINEEYNPNLGGNSSLIGSYFSQSQTPSTTTCKLLTEILFTDGKLVFSYSTTPGTNIRQLDDIKVFNQKGLIKSFGFFYSKFKNNGIAVTEKNALRLDSCVEINANGVRLSPFNFSYSSFNNYEVPTYNELQPESEDLWGYFNNSKIKNRLLVRSASIPANNFTPPISVAAGRKANSDYLMVGTLKSIKYPTGGEAVFKFEPNQIIRNYVRYDTTFSWFSKNISNMYAGPGDMSYATLTFNEPRRLLTQVKKIVNAFGGIEDYLYNVTFKFQVNQFCDPATNSNCKANRIDVSFVDLTTGLTLKRWQWDADFQQNPSLNMKADEALLTIDPSHNYQLKFNDATSLSGSESFAFRLDAYLTGKYNDFIVISTPLSETVLCGGLRIKEQQLSDPVTGKKIAKTYNYLKPYFNSNLFDGDFEKFSLNAFAFDRLEYYGTNNGGARLKYRTYTENLTVPIGSANNSSVSYEEIEEIQINPSNQINNGKTVYIFSKASDWITPFLPFYKFDNGDLRSQLLNKKVYAYANNSFKLLNETRFVYKNLIEPDKNKIKFVLSNMLFFDNINNHSGLYRYWWLGFPPKGGIYSQFAFSEESLQSRKYVEDSVITTEYAGVNPLVSETRYNYNNKVVPLPTEIINKNSKNEVTSQLIKYPADKLPVSNCTNNCEANFITQLNNLKVTLYQCQAPIISVFENNSNLNGNEAVANQARVDYQACIANFDNAVSGLITSTNTCIQTHESCHRNYYNGFSSEIAAIYDLINRNVISTPIEEKVFVNNKLISTRENAYHVFDQNNTVLSKVRASTGNILLEHKIQFNRYNTLGNILEQQKANDVKEVYLWGYNEQYPVAKIVGTDYSTAIAKVTQAQINSVTGVANNDVNVRSLLNNLRTISGTLVTTYTYEPLIGMTSQTDPSGKTIFYEYDSFGRLKTIKDKDGNILKTIDYQYQKPNNQ